MTGTKVGKRSERCRISLILLCGSGEKEERKKDRVCACQSQYRLRCRYTTYCTFSLFLPVNIYLRPALQTGAVSNVGDRHSQSRPIIVFSTNSGLGRAERATGLYFCTYISKIRIYVFRALSYRTTLPFNFSNLLEESSRVATPPFEGNKKSLKGRKVSWV